MLRRTFAGLALSAALIPAAKAQDWKATVKELRIGLLGGENASDRLKKHDGFQKLLESKLGIPVKMFPSADYAGVMQGMADPVVGAVQFAANLPGIRSLAGEHVAGGVGRRGAGRREHGMARCAVEWVGPVADDHHRGAERRGGASERPQPVAVRRAGQDHQRRVLAGRCDAHERGGTGGVVSLKRSQTSSSPAPSTRS